MGDISKLDAVNHMLLMAGESLVSDLEDNSGLDTEVSIFILDQLTRDIQLKGLANNKFIKRITLEAEGTIAIDSRAISAQLKSVHRNSEGHNIIAILKGTDNEKYLWNVTDQTDVFKKDIEYSYEIILGLPWEDMDTPVQRHILASASRQYQMVTQGDGDADEYLQQQEIFYQGKSLGADLNDKSRNIFTSSSDKLQEARSRNSYPRSSEYLRYWRTSRAR